MGLALASVLAFDCFLDFFFFFFFCATVVSSSTRDMAASSGGEAETVEFVQDGDIEGTWSTSWKMSAAEPSSWAMFAMRVNNSRR